MDKEKTGITSMKKIPGSKTELCEAWWLMFVTSAFGRLRQENHDFQASLGYTQRTCFERQNLFLDQEIVSQTGDPGNTYSEFPIALDWPLSFSPLR